MLDLRLPRWGTKGHDNIVANRWKWMTAARLMVFTGFCVPAAYYLTPVYQFYAHRGEVPMPPFGWQTLRPSQLERVPATQTLYDSDFQDAGEAALELIAQHRSHLGVPAYSAAVSVDGKLIWAAAVGWADIKADKAATPQTIFRIGSTSKALTATALARLVDRGHFDLDAPISTYLHERLLPKWSTITSRQLASHSSGLPHYKQNHEWQGIYHSVALQKHFEEPKDAISLFDESPLLFTPGSRFHYSSLGTVLLGATLSAAAHKSYRRVMNDEVFDRIGMSSTIVSPKQLSDKLTSSAFLATFYYRQGDRFRPWRPVDLSHRLPAAGWASTPSDLVRLGNAWLDPAYLSSDTRRQFWTPQPLSDGSINEQNYALGWRWHSFDTRDQGEVKFAHHGGVGRGAQCWLSVYPRYKISIALAMNTRTEVFRDFSHIHEALFTLFASTSTAQP